MYAGIIGQQKKGKKSGNAFNAETHEPKHEKNKFKN
jgi:hypothetical protein